MLKHPTLDLLGQLGLVGMAGAFADLASNDEAQGLGHAEWLALLLDHEATYRNDRRLALRLRHARLRHHAVPEPIIGHTKSDGLLERNHLAGPTGDAINAVLVAADHNMRLLLAWLAALWRVLITRHLLETQPRHANA